MRELCHHKPEREAPVFRMMMMTKGCQYIAENFLEFLWVAVVIQLIVEAVEQLLNPFVVARDHGQPPLAEATAEQ